MAAPTPAEACLALINEGREKPLTLDAAAAAVAQAHAEACANVGHSSHWDTDGRPPYARYAAGVASKHHGDGSSQ